MLGMTTSEAVASAIAGGGALLQIIYTAFAENRRKLHDAELTQLKTDNTTALAAAVAAGKAELAAAVAQQQAAADLKQKDIERLAGTIDTQAASLTKAWTQVDDLRINAARRADLKEYRDEVKREIEQVRDQLLEAIKELKTDIHNRPAGGA